MTQKRCIFCAMESMKKDRWWRLVSEKYLLEMKGISKSFPGVKALQNVNLQLKAGEVHALLGENVAG